MLLLSGCYAIILKKNFTNKGANYDFVDHLKRVTNDYNWKVVYGKPKQNMIA